jgi:hypothetical protein
LKKIFLLGLLLGIGGAVWVAGWYPFVDPVRFPSESGVARNGGRAESFHIQIPQDRVLRAVTPSAASPALPDGATLPASAADGAAELYKLRNASGKVIGLASRVWRGADAAYTDWTLLLPARGAVFLTATESGGPPAPSAAGAAATPRSVLGDVVGGSREFEGIVGSYSEEWTVERLDAEGRPVGDIEIMTLTQIGRLAP